MKTEEDVKAWVEENRDELIQNLKDCKEVPEFMKRPGDKFVDVWCAGCWLNEHLALLGATEEEVHEIGFAHGQRSLFGNTFRWAVKYYNEFKANREVKDKPGGKLADEINEKHVQTGDGFIAFAIEGND